MFFGPLEEFLAHLSVSLGLPAQPSDRLLGQALGITHVAFLQPDDTVFGHPIGVVSGSGEPFGRLVLVGYPQLLLSCGESLSCLPPMRVPAAMAPLDRHGYPPSSFPRPLVTGSPLYASKKASIASWYCSNASLQKPRYASPASVIEYIRRAGPPFVISHLDSQRPPFSICLKVRYSVPGFIASNPNAAARSISS